MATGTVHKKKRESRSLDTSNATRGVWLVKVPNYISESWKKAQNDQELGRMRISKYLLHMMFHSLYSFVIEKLTKRWCVQY